MKTFLLLFFVALGAGRLAAQTSPLNPTVRTNAAAAVTDYRLVMRSHNPYEVHSGRFIYDGLAVELYEAKNPVKLLTAPNPDQPPPTAGDRVWEQTKSDRTGLSIFTIKF